MTFKSILSAKLKRRKLDGLTLRTKVIDRVPFHDGAKLNKSAA